MLLFIKHIYSYILISCIYLDYDQHKGGDLCYGLRGRPALLRPGTLVRLLPHSYQPVQVSKGIILRIRLENHPPPPSSLNI